MSSKRSKVLHTPAIEPKPDTESIREVIARKFNCGLIEFRTIHGRDVLHIDGNPNPIGTGNQGEVYLLCVPLNGESKCDYAVRVQKVGGNRRNRVLADRTLELQEEASKRLLSVDSSKCVSVPRLYKYKDGLLSAWCTNTPDNNTVNLSIMDRVHGHTLRHILENNPDPRTVIDAVFNAVSILNSKCKLQHGDLNFDNIMYGDDCVYFIDFNIAGSYKYNDYMTMLPAILEAVSNPRITDSTLSYFYDKWISTLESFDLDSVAQRVVDSYDPDLPVRILIQQTFHPQEEWWPIINHTYMTANPKRLSDIVDHGWVFDLDFSYN